MTASEYVSSLLGECTPEQAFIYGVIVSFMFVPTVIYACKISEYICKSLYDALKELYQILRSRIRSRKTDTAD